MTDEERQRQRDFILSQQAQFAADMQKLREKQAQTDEGLDQTNQTLDRTVATLNSVTEMVVKDSPEWREKSPRSKRRLPNSTRSTRRGRPRWTSGSTG